MSFAQRTLTTLALLVPLVLVGLPYFGQLIERAMPPISGTYDVLLLAAPLPKEQVKALLPKSTFARPEASNDGSDVLQSIPDDVWRALKSIDEDGSFGEIDSAGQHLIFLQMGYQRQTGPGPAWLPKMSFGECKLEIPFVRHPSVDDAQADAPFVYKQHMLMDNTLIKTSSSVLGLTSSSAHFEPSKAPSVFAHDADKIRYKAGSDFLDAHAKQLLVPVQPAVADASSQTYTNLLHAWWFGARTGETVQKFDFDIAAAEVQPTAYDVSVDINLKAFAPAHGEALGDAYALSGGTTRLRGLGWRVRAPFVSRSERAGKIASN